MLGSVSFWSQQICSNKTLSKCSAHSTTLFNLGGAHSPIPAPQLGAESLTRGPWTPGRPAKGHLTQCSLMVLPALHYRAGGWVGIPGRCPATGTEQLRARPMESVPAATPHRVYSSPGWRTRAEAPWLPERHTAPPQPLCTAQACRAWLPLFLVQPPDPWFQARQGHRQENARLSRLHWWAHWCRRPGSEAGVPGFES